MIKFNEPLYLGCEDKYINKAIKINKKISGNGEFTQKCCEFMENKFKANKIFLTPSCTSALEMSAIVLDIKEGDEIIMPSFTFVSTANAFALRGASIVFVDIRPETMNINENLIEDAITKNTKAIVVMHYGGVACEMNKIIEVANKHNLYIIEDAAQAVMAKYENKYLGTIGDIGCYSFHETKNYTMGEGGAIVINDDSFTNKAKIIRDKGTNRDKFFKGEVDKYSWIDIGSSYLPSEINAAYLYPQLLESEKINNKRLKFWNLYNDNLKDLVDKKLIEVQKIPEGCKHNGHLFFIKLKDIEERNSMINFLKNKKIQSVFHYVPLHSSKAGKKYGRFNGEDIYTTKESERLLRLPLHINLREKDILYIADMIKEFFE